VHPKELVERTVCTLPAKVATSVIGDVSSLTADFTVLCVTKSAMLLVLLPSIEGWREGGYKLLKRICPYWQMNAVFKSK
jgi:hypothetical protein